LADARHRLPIVRFVAALNPFELEAGVTTRPLWKSTQAIERVAKKYDRFHQLYQY
jgi:hypothetical protein